MPPLDGRRTTAHRTTAHRISSLAFSQRWKLITTAVVIIPTAVVIIPTVVVIITNAVVIITTAVVINFHLGGNYYHRGGNHYHRGGNYYQRGGNHYHRGGNSVKKVSFTKKKPYYVTKKIACPIWATVLKTRRGPLAGKVGPISLCFQAPRFFSGYDVIPSISSNPYNFFIWEDFSLKLTRHTHIVIVKISHAERSTSGQFKILTFQNWYQFFDLRSLDTRSAVWSALKQTTDGATDAQLAEDRGSYPLSLWEVITGRRENALRRRPTCVFRGRPSFSSFTQVYREYSFQQLPPPLKVGIFIYWQAKKKKNQPLKGGLNPLTPPPPDPYWALLVLHRESRSWLFHITVYMGHNEKWWSYDRVPYSWYKHSMRDMTIPGCVGWRLHKAPEGADHLFMVSQDKDNDQRKTFLIIIFYYLEKRTSGPTSGPTPPPAYGLYARVNDENDGRHLNIRPYKHSVNYKLTVWLSVGNTDYSTLLPPPPQRLSTRPHAHHLCQRTNKASPADALSWHKYEISTASFKSEIRVEVMSWQGADCHFLLNGTVII